MKLLNDNCDDSVFRNKRNLFVPAYYEGITIGIGQNINRYKDDTSLMSIRIKELKNDEQFKKYSGTASNSKNRIRKRLERAIEIFDK
ncbi:MAG: hypothetical protein IKN43_14045 [Selenomonadaceae bacterium]|nr:hypothetical protein [Selenomonadaceae bacterium]